LYEEDKIRFDIYITGSNSKMLSSELSTLLTGRHRDIHVMPLSFKEFNEITKEKNFIKDFYKYAELGGLGIIIQNINEPNEAKKDLAMVLKDTIKKDVRKKHHNSSSILIDKTIKYALSNIGISISSHKIADKINKSENKKISHLPFFNYLK
jgi:predicted AAA+ superfamily ATPase